MIEVFGFIIIFSAINFFCWVVLGTIDFSLKECLVYSAVTELFLVALVIGCGMLTEWR